MRPGLRRHRRGQPRAGRPAPEGLPRAQDWTQVPCPHCGEELEVLVEADEDGSTRFEDCSACRRTVSLHVTWDDGEMLVETGRA
ncbi:MAG: CPXCG motif-containing cysteine-rich protein [Elusimicrobia bacterium]|nr:CPXCG motif-containing cysteine-rich protein [Elusimicrobiota bacterium]